MNKPLCADTRCEHPKGWHRLGAGSCLECGCTEFKQPPPLLEVLRQARDAAAVMEDNAPNESEATYFNGRAAAFQEALSLAEKALT